MEEGARTILALGPLTNLARILENSPGLLEHTEIVWMGGSLTSGNVTPAAEFNSYVDPDAADRVLRSGLAVRIVGLDVTRRVRLRPPDLPADGFGPGPRGRMLLTLLERLMNAEAVAHGEPCATLHDPGAAAAIAVPQLFRFEECQLEVRTEGTDRGRLVRRDGAAGAPVRYAMEVDAKGVVAFCLERLRHWSLENTEGTQEGECKRSR
jgi:inosine-uridine nucleoside N-ribohydrolase